MVSPVLRWVVVGLMVSAALPSVTPASVDRQEDAAEERKFVSKPNDIKKIRTQIDRQQAAGTVPEQQAGFQWGNLAGMALKLLVGGPAKSGPVDKADTITQLASGQLTWSKMISLVMEVVLSLLGGGDNNSLDRQDLEPSPIEHIFSAVLPYITGAQDPNEVTVMAKQASELLGLLVSLLDALRTSFSQRSLEARSLGSSDPMADVAVAATTMVKSYVRTYNTDDDLCMQKYLCEANHECVDGTSDSGYLFCQVATYGLSYLLERSTYTPFEIFTDAGRRGRVGEDCYQLFPDCNEV